MKNGIRTGGGRRGRGVYAVPLLFLPQVSFVQNGKEMMEMTAEPRPSITLWKWLAGRQHRHRHFAAIIFRTTRQHWPATLYIQLEPQVGIDWLDEIVPSHATVTAANLEHVRRCQNSGWLSNLEILIHNPSCLGKIMHRICAGGQSTWPRYDESIEIVFPQPISPNLIEQVIPLYRTNKQFKKSLKRQQDLSLHRDPESSDISPS